ncbi:uncharacterized protein LOC118212420 [Anguilla anguilla]|uniref:THD domain-containing protein n=1 Tax=Anguilla anguilla TaxID=7936 RepID=A0A9D3SB45_ANGAN|nr:uncharacterized protein LOC118212420 [Anguilla anguilla]XP_035246172.1 uncharacterized protein LOC118212420 [Anguilla anguilla]KAG5856617.1 hypothetical protein ANANG_G00009830 [Anguilla anguilla]
MGDEKMCTQKFLLLLVWCGLLSVAVVVMSVTQLTARHNTQDQVEDNNPQQNEPQSQPAQSSSTTGRPLSHIHLTIMDSNLTLNEDLPPHFASTSRSLVLRNNSVYVESGGLYHFYAQVTFGEMPNLTERTVTLIRNGILGQAERRLSEAVNWGTKEGSVSISRTIRCQKGQSFRLEIRPRMLFRYNAQYTYWGLFLLTPYGVREEKR